MFVNTCRPPVTDQFSMSALAIYSSLLGARGKYLDTNPEPALSPPISNERNIDWPPENQFKVAVTEVMPANAWPMRQSSSAAPGSRRRRLADRMRQN